MTENKTEIKDIFDGEYLSAWEDEEFVYLSFPWCIVTFPLEDWNDVLKELKELSNMNNKNLEDKK